ncbi:MAG: hypothetical protein GW823_08910 [Bacteroidetes bacterium]|nr:hypothetical protein [Bacteroidota bacterium]
MQLLKRILISYSLLFLVSCQTKLSEITPNLSEKYASTKEPWEKEVSSLLALDTLEIYPSNPYLFMGSSSIRLWETLKEDMSPLPVIQRGYGGAQYSDLIHFTELFIKPHKLGGIVIFVANDIRAQPDDKTPAEVLALFKEVVRISRKTHPNIPIYSIAITPTRSRWKAWPEIKISNELVKAYCNKTDNVHFIETDSVFLDEKGEPIDSLFREDKLHLTADGYKVWTKIIRKNLGL